VTKKHVVISCEGGDFSMDLIFAGLVKKFGKENVIDYPVRAKHRQGKPSLVGDDEKDYGAERRSLCYVEDCEDMKEWTEEEIGKLSVDEIGYVFLDETDESFKHFMNLYQLIPMKQKLAVVVAGHDSFRGSAPIVKNRLGFMFKHMFIDDWLPQYDNYDFASLINLSCNFDHLWDVSKRDELLKNKVYDICFIGYGSNPVRKLVIDHVNKKWGHLNNCIIFEDRQNKFDKFIRHDEMFKLMAQSKICLNLPGASTGGRALRYYEIPYVGSFMVSMEIQAKLLHPFTPTFNSLDGLDYFIEKSLSKEYDRELLAKQQHMMYRFYHTVDARMDYIFGVLEE